jgi:hypothetical protein
MTDTDDSIRSERAEEHIMLVPPRVARKGCGAVSNLQGRYELNNRERFDDGWFDEAADEFAKTILSRNTSPDIPLSVSLNPYRGCEHEMST